MLILFICSPLTHFLQGLSSLAGSMHLGACYARTGRSSRREASWSGVVSGTSALATCDADMWLEGVLSGEGNRL